ncbi:MAG: hypothetical protein AAGC55_34525, partial [Myxococcota bacterium]
RFAEYGLDCAVDDDDVYQYWSECTAASGSGYMYDVEDAAEFLRSVKDPSDVVVAGLLGDSETVDIAKIDGQLQVAPTQCSEGREQYPAIRLRDFIGSFGDRGLLAPYCGERADDALTTTARAIRKTLGTTCLDYRIADTDPLAAGDQVDCHISAVTRDGQPERIAECPTAPHDYPNSPVTPCYVIERGLAPCGDFPSQLSVRVWWGEDTEGRARAQPDEVRVTAECLVRPEPEIDIVVD